MSLTKLISLHELTRKGGAVHRRQNVSYAHTGHTPAFVVSPPVPDAAWQTRGPLPDAAECPVGTRSLVSWGGRCWGGGGEGGANAMSTGIRSSLPNISVAGVNPMLSCTAER